MVRKLFWFALFLIATFGFSVLFEYGTDDYSKNAQLEFQNIKKFIITKTERKKDESDKLGQ